MARTRSKATGAPGHAGNYDYLSLLKAPKVAPSPQVITEKTQALNPAEVKQRISLFHRNGKKHKPRMMRALCFTKEPYGFKETTIEETKLKAAGITPVKDDQGDIYLVIKAIDSAGAETLSRWPEGIAYPKVPSARLGRARNWDMVKSIVRSEKPSWLKQNAGVVLIVIVVLVLVFFMGYFFLMGGDSG